MLVRSKQVLEEDVSKLKRRLIVGLGNPGIEYAGTRHNLGQLVVSQLAQELQLTFKKEEKASAYVARSVFKGVSLHLLLPATYMNESGRAIHRYLSFYRFLTEELIVVVDDIALSYGERRLREEGSAGGHNGLKSIEKYIRTQKYVRLRMGIGQPREGQDLASYVLECFSSQEKQDLPKVLEAGVQALKYSVEHSTDLAMNFVNTKDWQWSKANHE